MLSNYVRYAAAFALRQRMLHFVQTYEHYMMFEVLEPSWHVMEKSLKSVWSMRHGYKYYYRGTQVQRL